MKVTTALLYERACRKDISCSILYSFVPFGVSVWEAIGVQQSLGMLNSSYKCKKCKEPKNGFLMPLSVEQRSISEYTSAVPGSIPS